MAEKIPTAFGMVTPTDEPLSGAFMPSGWFEQIQQRMLDNLKEQSRKWSKMAGVDPDNRPTILEERDADPEWMRARRRFKKRWKRLVKEGLREGWLEHDHCYECGGELKVTKNTTEWVKVPNPDFDPDKSNPYTQRLAEGDTVTIPTIWDAAQIRIPTAEETR